jgi:hypothetical protein
MTFRVLTLLNDSPPVTYSRMTGGSKRATDHGRRSSFSQRNFQRCTRSRVLLEGGSATRVQGSVSLNDALGKLVADAA